MEPFTLRPLEISDAEVIYRHLASGEVGKYLSELPSPYTLNDAQGFIALNYSSFSPFTNNRAIVWSETNSLIGVIGLKNLDRNKQDAELGYWLAQPYWGKGVITAAIREYAAEAFIELKLKQIYARVFEPNTASIKALERNGFTRAKGYVEESCNTKVNEPMLKLVKTRNI